jgi:hypothetical protein
MLFDIIIYAFAFVADIIVSLFVALTGWIEVPTALTNAVTGISSYIALLAGFFPDNFFVHFVASMSFLGIVQLAILPFLVARSVRLPFVNIHKQD